MVIKRAPKPPTVLLATSAGVRITPAGTSGFLLSASWLKSPVRSRWLGNRDEEENLNGVKFQRRSYDPRKKVRLLPGTGPLIDPPTSFKL